MVALYFFLTVAYGVASTQYRTANSVTGCRPDVGITPQIFDILGMLSTIAVLVSLIAGFFLFSWLIPVIALLLVWLSVAITKTISPIYSAACTMLFGAVAVVFTVIFVLAKATSSSSTPSFL